MTFNWLSNLAFFVAPRLRQRAELRATWGRVVEPDDWLASRSFDLLPSRGECGVFVIDEIFSATNTIERVAAAKAVLSAISRRAQVLATTHDVELQQLLAPDFDLFHFQENLDVEGFFDFKLHSGISTQRNAIRVLERMGIPEEIIGEALALVAGQSHKDTR